MITIESSTEEIQRQLSQDHECPACKGSGKRGRGKCRKCDGTGSAMPDGYREACQDRMLRGLEDSRRDSRMNRARTVVDEGAHTSKQVSRSYDQWYCLGYECGLEDLGETFLRGLFRDLD